MSKLQFQTYGNEKQKEALRILLDNSNGITDIGFGGGAGGAKSYTGVVWQWIVRNKYPGTKGFFGRKELKRLKQTTLATYYKFCEDYKIPQSQRGVLNNQDSVIKFANGSEILLLDLSYMPSDPLYTRFGSLELTDGFADEIAEIDSQCLMILKTRIGRQKNEEYNLLPKFLGTFNPDKGHVYRDYYKPHKEGKLLDYRVFIPSLATDNKKLPKTYIDQLMKADEVTKQRLLYGNFDYDDTPGRLFDYNKILELQSNTPIYGEKFITCNPAREGRDKTIIMLWNGLVIEKVIMEEKSNLKELKVTIRTLALREGVKISHIIVDENGLGGGLVDELGCQGFINNARQIEPKIMTNQVSQLRKPNYDMLKTQCYHLLSQYVNNSKIRYNGDSNLFSKLVEELDIIVQVDIDKDGKFKIISKEDIKEKLGRSPDVSDCMMFRMFYEIRKPIDLSGVQSIEEIITLSPYDYKPQEESIEFEIEIDPYN